MLPAAVSCMSFRQSSHSVIRHVTGAGFIIHTQKSMQRGGNTVPAVCYRPDTCKTIGGRQTWQSATDRRGHMFPPGPSTLLRNESEPATWHATAHYPQKCNRQKCAEGQRKVIQQLSDGGHTVGFPDPIQTPDQKWGLGPHAPGGGLQTAEKHTPRAHHPHPPRLPSLRRPPGRASGKKSRRFLRKTIFRRFFWF